MKKLVIVESPAKSKTINTYLGPDYHVMASYGHIRDLPTKNGSVLPEKNFEMTWELNDRGQKQIKEMVSQLKSCDEVLLATDPDREGEAISWHVTEELKSRKALAGKTVRRVVFNELTKSAILHAIEHPRDLDSNLISAYLARRSLDYLMGFTLSPVLWRKLPGSRSAGRVQSVALRLIADRETEIEAFRTQEYWSIHALFSEKSTFKSQMIEYDGTKLEKLDIKSETQANTMMDSVKGLSFSVVDVQKKSTNRNPFAPFITSSLQQEASRKLGFSASKTMQIAQQLYEGAFITYMRTDSTTLSKEALDAARSFIDKNFSKEYLPAQPRQYQTKSKNAQEAHEAIRPVDMFSTPASLKKKLNDDMWALYDLVWKRTVASQMSAAILDQTRIDLQDEKKHSIFRATGSVLRFDGFLTLYNESDEDQAAEEDKLLPALEVGQKVNCKDISAEQHFTSPPPRYTEATLIKKLEELGIGRPATYVSIIKVLQDRDYVRLEKKRFFCEDRGRIVTIFLKNFFDRYVEFDFTAHMEELLDDIAEGKAVWNNVLKEFWTTLQADVTATNTLRITEVIDKLNAELEEYLFPKTEANQDNPRKCPECADGLLSLKLGKFGSFVGCSNYPTCNYTRKLSSDGENSEENVSLTETFEPRVIGNHPEHHKEILLKKGPYGLYLEMEDPNPPVEETGKKKKTKPKPKRASLPKDIDPDALDMDAAVQLLSLPRYVGVHPETKQDIIANKGRFGPYLQHNSAFTKIVAPFSPYTISEEDAVALINKPKAAPRKKTK